MGAGWGLGGGSSSSASVGWMVETSGTATTPTTDDGLRFGSSASREVSLSIGLDVRMGLSPSWIGDLFSHSSTSHGQPESKRLGTADRRASLAFAAQFYLDFCKTLIVYDLQTRESSCIKKIKCFGFTEADSHSIPFSGERGPDRSSRLARRFHLPATRETNIRSNRTTSVALEDQLRKCMVGC